MKTNPYRTLSYTVGIHFFIMYALTYTSVNSWDDISLFSTRSFYMAVVMVAPMVILMLWFMRHMYEDRTRNVILYTASALLFVAFFFFIRTQTFVGDERFIESMIPHHSGAITMCEEATITDQELAQLCEEIVRAQQEEIAQMNAIYQRLRGQ